MMLSYVLRHLDSRQYQAALFCPQRGKLLPEMPGHVPTYSLAPVRNAWTRLPGKVLEQLQGTSLYERSVRRVHNRFQPDLWYVNTILMPEITQLANRLRVPYVLHVHEMPLAYKYVSKQNLRQMIDGASLTIACSRTVLDYLRLLGSTNIELLYECVDFSRIEPRNDTAMALRRSLGIDRAAYVWVMSGFVDYLKGADVIIEVAKTLSGSNVHFLWLGSSSFGTSPETGYQYFIEKAIDQYEMKNVHFLGNQTDNYYNYLECADGFLLTSRGDSFPLVMIEAAALGKPIVSFNSGGVSEFVQPGMGTVIDSWDVAELVKAMAAVMNKSIVLDPDISRKRAAEFDVSTQVGQWSRIIQKHFGQPSQDQNGF